MGLGRFMGKMKAGKYSAITGAPSLDSPTADAHLLHLAERIETLTTIVGATWSMLERSGHTQNQLEAELRARDPFYDVPETRRSYTAWQCTDCDAWLTDELDRCQFCGHLRPTGNDRDVNADSGDPDSTSP